MRCFLLLFISVLQINTVSGVTQWKNTVDGSKVFVHETTYDVFVRVEKDTYPGCYSVTNKYDKYIYLTGITYINNANIWNALQINAKGQLTQSSQGGRTTTFSFDSRRFPTSIYNPGIVNMGYSFTTRGNLDYSQDNLTDYKASFGYDALNRMTNWTIYQNYVQQAANSLTYNSATGLNNSKSDLGSYAMNYGEGEKTPHALNSIDGIPGLIPSYAQSITYTDFRKVNQIIEGGSVLNISYRTDDQRTKSTLTKPSGTLTCYYMVNYEEEVSNGVTRKIHYIKGGNGLAAIY